MHYIQRLIICSMALFCFACAFLQKNEGNEDTYKVNTSPDAVGECIIPDIEAGKTMDLSESISVTEIMEDQVYDSSVSEIVQAFLEGNWFSQFQQERRPLILLIPSKIEPDYAEQESSILELVKDELLKSYAVNLVVCDSSFILSSHQDSLLYIKEQSGADFLLQSRYLMEDDIPLLELKLYNFTDMALVYNETSSLIKIKI
ncbi:MAG: hypothetical protein M0P53_01020 [Candidatus Cloacimonas sp.]|nr:hypothetical protein [Candidatus Cloacimonas sp.]